MEQTNRAVDRLAENARDSYQTVMVHAVGLQERNVRLAQGIVDGTIKELHHQAEGSRSVVGQLFERAEEGRGAYQALDAYMKFAYAPLAYYKESLEATRKATRK